jgi:hypothetical protein
MGVKPQGDLMYFWKVEELKSELISNGLSQKSLFIYILIYMIFVRVVVEAGYLFPTEDAPTTFTYIQAIIDLPNPDIEI